MVSPTLARRIDYPIYKSTYGPKYLYQTNFHGWTGQQVFRLGLKSAAFGGSALVAVLFYASGIPRVQRDVLQKIPLVGGLFIKEPIPVSDNPF